MKTKTNEGIKGNIPLENIVHMITYRTIQDENPENEANF